LYYTVLKLKLAPNTLPGNDQPGREGQMDQDNGRTHEKDWAAPVYAPSLLPLMQSLLATLANIDAEHEHEVERATRSSAPASLKPRLLAKLNERHRERRESYVRHLALLQGRVHSRSV